MLSVLSEKSKKVVRRKRRRKKRDEESDYTGPEWRGPTYLSKMPRHQLPQLKKKARVAKKPTRLKDFVVELDAEATTLLPHQIAGISEDILVESFSEDEVRCHCHHGFYHNFDFPSTGECNVYIELK